MWHIARTDHHHNEKDREHLRPMHVTIDLMLRHNCWWDEKENEEKKVANLTKCSYTIYVYIVLISPFLFFSFFFTDDHRKPNNKGLSFLRWIQRAQGSLHLGWIEIIYIFRKNNDIDLVGYETSHTSSWPS